MIIFIIIDNFVKKYFMGRELNPESTAAEFQ
jgi:hypothetical protein